MRRVKARARQRLADGGLDGAARHRGRGYVVHRDRVCLDDRAGDRVHGQCADALGLGVLLHTDKIDLVGVAGDFHDDIADLARAGTGDGDGGLRHALERGVTEILDDNDVDEQHRHERQNQNHIKLAELSFQFGFHGNSSRKVKVRGNRTDVNTYKSLQEMRKFCKRKCAKLQKMTDVKRARYGLLTICKTVGHVYLLSLKKSLSSSAQFSRRTPG